MSIRYDRKDRLAHGDIERGSPGALERPELRDMIKRAKEYAKRM